MKIIKETIPETEWETKNGELGYNFGFTFGKAVKTNSYTMLPIKPSFIFMVDNKEFGQFECEETVEIVRHLSEEKFLISVYQNLLTTLIEFDTLVKSKFAIPSEIQFNPPTFDKIKDKLINDLGELID